MNRTEAQKQNLIVLAEFLEKLSRARFNFRRWVGADWEGKPDLSCGTTACAFGWATAIPHFQEQGLYLRPGEGNLGNGVPLLKGHEREGYFDDTRYAGHVLFGIDEEEFDILFIPREDHCESSKSEGLPADAGPEDVARLLRYLAEHGSFEGCEYPAEEEEGV